MFQFLMLQWLAEPLRAGSGCDAHCLHWNKLTPCQGYYSAVDLYFFCEWCLAFFPWWFLGYLMSMQYSADFAYICYLQLDRQSQHGSDVSERCVYARNLHMYQHVTDTHLWTLTNSHDYNNSTWFTLTTLSTTQKIPVLHRSDSELTWKQGFFRTISFKE